MAGNPNERHKIATLSAAPLNVSPAQIEEMQTCAYLLRMACVGRDGPEARRLKHLALSIELETDEGKRIYKYARQRALEPERLRQLKQGIVAVTDGELAALGLKS